ncbi:MAG: cupredoxin domain-containing protein, partial [Actinomycetota bacterium]
GWLYLAFPIALFTSPAIRELAFNLSAVDSVAWRWYSVVSLVSLGLATAGAILVGRHGRHGRRRPAAEAVASPDRSGDVGPVWLAAGGGGLVLGLAFLLLAPAVAGNPGFGRELSDDELAALPTIDLLNYRYDPGVVSVDASGITRFRLENPTDVPHTVTIDAIDLEVWVPARRWSVIEFDAGELSERLAFYCSVGDHRQLGMSGVLQVGA